jgi:hypothetical protein
MSRRVSAVAVCLLALLVLGAASAPPALSTNRILVITLAVAGFLPVLTLRGWRWRLLAGVVALAVAIAAFWWLRQLPPDALRRLSKVATWRPTEEFKGMALNAGALLVGGLLACALVDVALVVVGVGVPLSRRSQEKTRAA